MRVKLDGNRAGGRDDRRKERPCALRREQAGRVLDRDEIGVQCAQLPRALDVVRIGVHRAQRVGDHRVHEHSRLVRRAHRRFDVAVVVERVVDCEHPDAEVGQHAGVERDHVVGKELERVKALAARQRVAGRGEAAAEQRDAPVGILVEEAHGNVEHRATQDIDVLVADAIERAQDGRHHRGGHPRRPQALMAVAERDVDETEAARDGLRKLAHDESRSHSRNSHCRRFP